MHSSFSRLFASMILALVLSMPLPINPASAGEMESGLVRVKSSYPMTVTIDRLKQDIASKGIMLFSEIDQAELAADAGIKLGPSTLLVFGNPGLGTQFMTSQPTAGIDWPVRLLIFEDHGGNVWAVYSDFSYIARRHGITDRMEAFDMASQVIALITSSVAGN